MDTQNDHAHVIVNPFLIYIALGLCALVLQKLAPLPFLAQPIARVLG